MDTAHGPRSGGGSHVYEAWLVDVTLVLNDVQSWAEFFHRCMARWRWPEGTP